MPDFGSLTPESGAQVPPVLSICSALFGNGILSAEFEGVPTYASTVLVANQAQAYPFRLTRSATVRKFGLANGATVTGNIDIGIYNEALTRLVSTGAVAQAGTTTLQEFDVTDLLLVAGIYYLAISPSGAAPVMQFTPLNQPSTAGSGGKQMGAIQMAAAHPLPTTFVAAVNTLAGIPDMGIFFRATP